MRFLREKKLAVLVMAAGSIAGPLVGHAATTTATWIGSAGANWDAAGVWNPSEPGNGTDDEAIFNTSGASANLDTSVALGIADTLLGIHETLLVMVLSRSEELNLSEMGPLLDHLAEAATEVTVQGPVQKQEMISADESQTAGSSSSLNLNASNPSLELAASDSATSSGHVQHTLAQSGTILHRVHFGTVAKVLQKITAALGNRHLWVLLDEWSVSAPPTPPTRWDAMNRTFA